jgi:ferrous iron transport protein A
MNRSPSDAPKPLCQLTAGTTGRVCQLTGDAHFCQRVREMGFGESACVTKISGTSTIICQVSGTRIALSHAAASNILVEQLGARMSLQG